MVYVSLSILYGSATSLAAGLATGIGALPVFLLRNVPEKVMDALVGFAAGVMLAATFFSLLLPSMEIGGIIPASLGLLAGVATIHLIDRFIPHFHPVTGVEGGRSKLAKVWLLIIAMTIHNFPEGLAVGVSFGGGAFDVGFTVAIAIGLQNIPEGLAVAVPLVNEGYGRLKAARYATLTGLVEPVGGVLGASLVTAFTATFPWALALAAGAMLYIVSDEMIPESHAKGHEREATLGVISGFIVMMILDTIMA
nr:ZIP family metal transporter [Candidatus Bathyarchaeota archaeon]